MSDLRIAEREHGWGTRISVVGETDDYGAEVFHVDVWRPDPDRIAPLRAAQINWQAIGDTDAETTRRVAEALILAAHLAARYEREEVPS